MGEVISVGFIMAASIAVFIAYNSGGYGGGGAFG